MKKKKIIRLANTNIYYEVGEAKPMKHIVFTTPFLAYELYKKYAKTPDDKKRTETELPEAEGS